MSLILIIAFWQPQRYGGFLTHATVAKSSNNYFCHENAKLRASRKSETSFSHQKILTIRDY
jgi:hypothetical protein